MRSQVSFGKDYARLAFAGAIAVAWLASGAAVGQSPQEQEQDQRPAAQQPGQPPRQPYPGEAMDDPYADAPPRLQQDYQRPDPYLPWGYRRSRPPYFDPPRSYYDYGGAFRRGGFDRPPLHTYDYDYSNYYHYYPPRDGYYPDPYQATYEEAYRQGVDDGRHFEQFEQAAVRGITSYLDAMDMGLKTFAEGRYADAADVFILAARLNQGDPASRIHAAQAMLAQGLDAEAVAMLRRAIELEPRIVHLPLDLRADYGVADDFDRQMQALSQRAADPRNADAAILLGYQYLFSGRGELAMEPLARAAELRPDDPLIRRLMGRAQLRAPRGGSGSP